MFRVNESISKSIFFLTHRTNSSSGDIKTNEYTVKQRLMKYLHHQSKPSSSVNEAPDIFEEVSEGSARCGKFFPGDVPISVHYFAFDL